MRTRLSVNVNKIALLRNSRNNNNPDVASLAKIALKAGAHGITIHPRPDERHIKASDVPILGDVVRGFEEAEFNIEGNPFHQLMNLAREYRPHQCTLVPDEEDAKTSNCGWDCEQDYSKLSPVVAELKKLNIRVSLFMDPNPIQMRIAKDLGADRIELYTEAYASAYNTRQRADVTSRYRDAALAAIEAGLEVNAGHDLDLGNLSYFLSEVPLIQEVSIGHALTADALERGMSRVVVEYLEAIQKGNIE